MEQEKEVAAFVKGINNLKNHGDSSTITSWVEEKCKMGLSDECPHLFSKKRNVKM